MGMSLNEARQINEKFDGLEAKIVAIQFMLCQNLAAQYLDAGITETMMDENHQDLRNTFQKLRFKAMSAVESDAWADAIQQALDALLTQIERSYQIRAAG